MKLTLKKEKVKENITSDALNSGFKEMEELFVCAHEQGYSIIFDDSICFDLPIVMRLKEIKQDIDKQ